MDKREEMLKALTGYGERSLEGLDRMGQAYLNAVRSAPKPLQDAGDFVAPFMPGYRAMEGARMATESGRLWRQGRHGDAMIRMADAMDAPLDELGWLIPGMGRLVGKMPK